MSLRFNEVAQENVLSGDSHMILTEHVHTALYELKIVICTYAGYKTIAKPVSFTRICSKGPGSYDRQRCRRGPRISKELEHRDKDP